MSVLDNIRSFLRLVVSGQPRQAILAGYVEILRRLYALLPHDGITIVDEKWDHLVVLDACRYDYYERLTTFEGTPEKRTSSASSTSEWLKTNFTEYYDDIVYVSANPRISDEEVDGFRGTDHFHDVINVWRTDWDEDLNTVEPDDVTDAAIEAREQYPDKRLVVHYIQPHAPWIGETKLQDRETTIADPTPTEWIETGKTWGTMLNEGIPEDQVRQAYADNVELVVQAVERLLAALEGRVVVTSDHGECFGEKFLIEHPPGIYVDELVEVPWHVIDAGRPPESRADRNADSVAEDPSAEQPRTRTALGWSASEGSADP